MHNVFIIAEAGVNHNGSLRTAMRMVDAAAEAGADAIKFQTFTADALVLACAPKATYQKKACARTESQYEMLRKLELDVLAHKKLIARCRKRRIEFISSPFDVQSVSLLAGLRLRVIKIPSGEITNYPYLRALGKLNKRILLSTGMSDTEEIRSAIRVLCASGTSKKNITLLHCNTEYPTPWQDANLRAIACLHDVFGLPVGYSDHTPGIEASVAAVALGAAVIEKHFTLSKKMKGPDHAASIEPRELSRLVCAARHVELALGEKRKFVTASEKNNKPVVRKSIVAASDIRKGDRFTEHNLTTKRPGTGLSPMRWNQVVGKRAKKEFLRDEMITV